MVLAIPFSKLHGTGNDFVVIDDRAATTPTMTMSQRRWLCDRHLGVGADGVLTILAGERGRFRMHITNPDGSVPEMCGNGLRCVALELARRGDVPRQQPVVIDTDAGPKTVVVNDDEVTIDMGVPALASPQFHPDAAQRVSAATKNHARCVSMGNPHVVQFVSALPSIEVATIEGSRIEHDADLFPSRTNVEWAVIGDGTDVLVWERGVGLTQACGTGACAVVVAAIVDKHVAPGQHQVRLPGGPISVRWSGALDDSVWMTGPAKLSFTGHCVAQDLVQNLVGQGG
jgi:diaminopimelate epimerase